MIIDEAHSSQSGSSADTLNMTLSKEEAPEDNQDKILNAKTFAVKIFEFSGDVYWFLKFLIPKLIVRNPQQDRFDELLNSIDLSTYGIERVTLNQAIKRSPLMILPPK